MAIPLEPGRKVCLYYQGDPPPAPEPPPLAAHQPRHWAKEHAKALEMKRPWYQIYITCTFQMVSRLRKSGDSYSLTFMRTDADVIQNIIFLKIMIMMINLTLTI